MIAANVSLQSNLSYLLFNSLFVRRGFRICGVQQTLNKLCRKQLYMYNAIEMQT